MPIPDSKRMTPKAKSLLARAMQDPDGWVVVMQYEAKDREVTERHVSPIKFIGQTAMLALCLCREEPRRFELGKCDGVRLVRAEDVLMPVEIKTLAKAQ